MLFRVIQIKHTLLKRILAFEVIKPSRRRLGDSCMSNISAKAAETVSQINITVMKHSQKGEDDVAQNPCALYATASQPAFPSLRTMVRRTKEERGDERGHGGRESKRGAGEVG